MSEPLEERVYEKVVVCRHQFFVEEQFPFPVGIGVGDCNNCGYDPLNNAKCTGYRPMSALRIKVTGKEDVA